MPNKTTYKNLDWGLEAKRVARAFDIEDECCFKPEAGVITTDTSSPTSRILTWENGENRHPIGERKGLYFSCFYRNPYGKYFHIDNYEHGQDFTEIAILWNNRLRFRAGTTAYSCLLAKGLFNLDLLTPAIEAALGVTITSHLKMEWTCEYGERYGL